jgi:hypothetical protein
MVRKKDGSWRHCGDYRRLNLATALPSILDLSNKLHGCKFFSCIDLVKGYHQIPMTAQDIAKTAIITKFGLFEYLFMLFGLHNAAQTFQRFMDSLLKHLPFVFCYLDDIIIASHSLEEHLFTILQENSLQINPVKCVFAAARACLHCQRGKVHRHVHLQPAEILVPHCRFAHIHVDLVEPLPASCGHTYLFTIIDRTSRWPEAIPLASISTADCARALFASWVSQFGVPATITSDRGAQFTSALWAGLCSLLNIRHSPTTAYHPQSNGLVERFHRRLKDALRSLAAAAEWHNHLPWVLLGIRTACSEDSEFSLAEAVYGSQLVLPGQFINTAESPSPSFLRELQTTMTGRLPPPARHNAAPAPSALPEELLLARFVLVRRDGVQPPLSPIFDGPYRVLERSTHFFLLEMGDRTDKVSTLRLKAARTPADTEPAKPPRRGHPVAQAPPVHAPPPKQRGRPRQVTFSLPPTTPPTTTSASSASGHPLRSTRPPNRLNL